MNTNTCIILLAIGLLMICTAFTGLNSLKFKQQQIAFNTTQLELDKKIAKEFSIDINGVVSSAKPVTNNNYFVNNNE